jgi:hypothetical protein
MKVIFQNVFADPTKRRIDLTWLSTMQTDAVEDLVVKKLPPRRSGIMWDLGVSEIILLFLFYRSKVLGTYRERNLGCANRFRSPKTSKVRRFGNKLLGRKTALALESCSVEAREHHQH